MVWTIFAVADLAVAVLLIDLMTTTVPPEKLSRVRKARNATGVLLIISVIVLVTQIAHRYAVSAG